MEESMQICGIQVFVMLYSKGQDLRRYSCSQSCMRIKLLIQRLNYIYEGMESKVLCTEFRIRIRVR